MSLRRGSPAPSRGRDWRLAAFGTGCSALGTFCLLLAACSSTPTRPEPQAASPSLPAAPIAPVPVVHEIAVLPQTAETPTSPWDRLRHRFAMPGCDYSPAVQRWARLFTAGPNRFSASLAEAMPYLLVVIDQLERRDLPGEFAFLPYVESTYTPIPATGDRAAGMWQLIPGTARAAGLRITPEYDGRLDVYASSVAALDLIEQYEHEFGDWRLANMAFNAGENAVKPLVDGRVPGYDARQLGMLHLPLQTHDHLAKLLALACVISQPQNYHVTLPEPRDDDELVLLEFPAAVDLRLAARLAGLDEAHMRRFNPGFLRSRMPAEGPFHLLVPVARRVAIEQTLGKLPPYAWRDWHEAILKQAETLDTFAQLNDLDPDALSAINGVDARATLAPGTRLLLPGRGSDAAIATDVPSQETSAVPPETLIVHAGDTLWDIARRYGMRTEDLRRWNGLAQNPTLRLGQRLRLTAPDSGAIAGTH